MQDESTYCPPPRTQAPDVPGAAPSPPPAGPTWQRTTSRAWKQARGAGRLVVGRFRQVDFRREVWPLDGSAARRLSAEPTFWVVALLGGLPLFFGTLSEPRYGLVAFSLFFAAVWGLIFCHLVRGATVAWHWRVACLLFTGLVGIPLLLWVYRLLPAWYMGLAESPDQLPRLLGFLGQVGVCEEGLKLLPVLALAALLRNRLGAADLVLLGVFSGLGFAAFENLSKYDSLIHAVQQQLTTPDAPTALTSPAQQIEQQAQVARGMANTMLMPLTRSISATFAHAVWAGILAHFLAAGRGTGPKRLPLLLCGWAVAAALHGAYDWLIAIQPVLPAAVAVVSFMLFMLYLQGQGTPADPAHAAARTQPALG